MAGAVLFVHQVFPGQFKRLAAELVARGVTCKAVGSHIAPGLEGVELVAYGLSRGNTEGLHPLAVGPESDFMRGSAAYSAAKRLRDQGFRPDVIVGHTGWGETVFLKELFPQARIVIFPEYFPNTGGYVNFDPEFHTEPERETLSAKARGAVALLAYNDADAIVCPTRFQADTVPAAYQPRVRVIHEGIPLAAIQRFPPLRLRLPDDRVIEPGTPVITHVNQQLEPMRGLHIFARSLPRLLAEVPEAHVLIIGGVAQDGSGYSGKPPEGRTWKEVCLEGVDLDMRRVHFMGHVQHEVMWAALQMSWAHVYYTWPFVLSWSLIEALALGCYVIGSDTAPLREVIDDGVNGRLLPFFDVDALSSTLIEACRDPQASRPLREAAQRSAQAYDSVEGTRRWVELLQELGLEVGEAAPALPA